MCFSRNLRRMLWLHAETSWRTEQRLKGFIMSENAKAIEEVTAQLAKVRTEIVAKVDTLQAAVDRGDNLNGPLGDLRKAAQALDDLVPDEDGGLETTGPATQDGVYQPQENVPAEEAAVDGGNGREAADETRESDEEVSEVAAEKAKKK